MTQLNIKDSAARDVHQLISKYIDSIKEDLWALNKQIHDNPEIAFQEHATHDAITKFLEDHGRSVTRHAYSLDTSFESRSGSTGPLVNFNAEYDALPGLGHACGHNLICSAGVAAYMALSYFLDDNPDFVGQVQLLGTPAEEAGGGKVLLLDAGAYDGVDVSLMAHPTSVYAYPDPYTGIAGQPTLASADLRAAYTGRSAHAAANPWDGINALDAVVSSYNNVSMLRQQIRPDERIHGAILETPPIPNAIPAHTVMKYMVRTPTLATMEPLVGRVTKCLEAGAVATGCDLDLARDGPDYADVQVNEPLAAAFTGAMRSWDVPLLVSTAEPVAASTDMGNVSHVLPGLHAMVGVPTDDKMAFPHNPAFERVAGTREAFERFVVVAKALAAVAWRVWVDDGFCAEVRRDFDRTAKVTARGMGKGK